MIQTDKKPKYKLETWKNGLFIVARKKGKFVKGYPKKVISQEVKNYPKGVYNVYVVINKKNKSGKSRVRQLTTQTKNADWWKEREQVIAKRQIFRSSYVLNNIPISKVYSFFKYADRRGIESWTVGFRINAFSRNRQALAELKPKLKQRLIKFIEQTLKYNAGEWWFDSYFGYEAPTNVNASKIDNGRYYLTLENQRGYVIKSEEGRLSDL